MQNKLTLWSVLFLFSIFTSNPIYSAEIHSREGGEWENPNSWEGGQVPTPEDDVYIHNEHKIKIHESATIVSLIVEGILILDVKIEAFKVLKSIHIKEKGELIVDEFKEQKLIVVGNIINEHIIRIPYIEFNNDDDVVFVSKNELNIQRIIVAPKEERAKISLQFESLKIFNGSENWLELNTGHVLIQGFFEMQSPTLYFDKSNGGQAFINEKSTLTIDNPAYQFNISESSFLVKGKFSMLQGKCNIGSAPDHDLQYSNGATLNFEGGEVNITGLIVSKGKANSINFGGANIWINTLSPVSIDRSLLDVVAIEANISGTNVHFANPVVSQKESIYFAVDKLNSQNGFYFFHNPAKVNFPYYINGKFDNIEILDDNNRVVLTNDSEIKNLIIFKGSTIDLNGKNLRIQNEIQNNGAVQANNGDLYFVGENTQKISGKGNFGTKTEPLNGVFFDNAKNIILDVDAFYLKNAFLQKGKIINSQKLIFDKNAIVSIGGNDGKSDAGSFDQVPNYDADGLLTLIYQKQAKKSKMAYEMPSSKQLEKLIVANEKGVELNNNLQINKQLDLQNGVLSIDNFYLTILGKINTVGSRKSYVATNGSGTLKQIVGKDEVLFPIGLNEKSYDPVKIINRGKEDFFSISVKDEVLYAGNKDKVLFRNWEVTEAVEGESLIDIALSFDSSATHGTTFNKKADIVMGIFSAKKELWTEIATSQATNFYQSSGHKTFSNFALSNRTGLMPANLPAEFRGKLVSGDAFLTWTTLSEANNKSFTIEKSSDLKNFTAIKTIAAAGFSSSPKNYSHTDVDFFRTSYYRLRQESNDGKISFSNAIVVYKKENNNITLFPNPISSKELLNIRTIDNKPYLMEIYDNNGRLIESHEVENRDFQLDLKAYQSGTYFVRTIDENNQILTSRLMVTNF